MPDPLTRHGCSGVQVSQGVIQAFAVQGLGVKQIQRRVVRRREVGR